jgi:phospho-N-acetylmuramoyl-pentapeptide-transferase
MDGLAAGCMIISGLALLVFCYVSGRVDWTEYLNLPLVSQASEMAVLGGALCGACMGFLWYNAYPAQVFMGDSGSLPLGGALAWMALVSKQELVLPLIAIVFVADLGTSLLQTVWFKQTGGRRLFTLAPIHHGLERYGGVFQRRERGWHEVQVVVRFWIIAACGAMASLALLKVR